MSDPEPLQAKTIEPRAAPFQVGEWVAQPAWNRIRRNSETVKLEPLVMRLLAALAAKPGRPLLRQELLDTVWPDTIVNEEALSRAVSQLRRALGDDSKAPRYLQTVHKGGYCLIAPVTAALADAAPASPPEPRRRWMPPWPLLLLLAGIAALLLYLAVKPSTHQLASRPLVPITSAPGREIDPAISPDGKRIAYLASRDSGYDLLVRDLEGGGTLRLTGSALSKGHPVWSPTGDRIAFVGAQGDAAAIYVVPSKGGQPVKFVDLPSWSYGLDWSPDGRTLAFSDAAPGETPGIVFIDVLSKAVRPVARSDSSAGDVKPAFSPDGRRLAFLRRDQLERQQIAVVDLLQGSAAKILPAPAQQLRGLDWAPDGKSLLFSAKSGRRFGLWRLQADGSRSPEVYPIEGGDVFNPSISRDGRIAVEEVEQDRDIWRTDLAGSNPVPVIQSTVDDFDPVYESSGSRLAFVSERSGTPEVWIQSPAGEARRLTKLSGPDVRSLTWSADGTKLAFVGEDEGTSSIYSTGVGGGEPIRLFETRQGQAPIGWSATGDALYVLSPDGGDWRLNVFDLSRRAMRNELAPALRAAALAPDGRTILAVAAGENKLIAIVPGQGIVRQLRLPPLSGRLVLVASREAVFIVEDALGRATVRRLDLKSGAVTTVSELESYSGGAVSLSPGARWIVYTRARETANDLAWIQL